MTTVIAHDIIQVTKVHYERYRRRSRENVRPATYAVETLCNRLERHAAAFILSMLKTNAAAWRFHSVFDGTLWQRCGNAVGSSRAPWARCERARCKDAV